MHWWCFEIDNNQLEWNDLNIDLIAYISKENNIKRDYIQLTHDGGRSCAKLYVPADVNIKKGLLKEIKRENTCYWKWSLLLRIVNFRLFRWTMDNAMAVATTTNGGVGGGGGGGLTHRSLTLRWLTFVNFFVRCEITHILPYLVHTGRCYNFRLSISSVCISFARSARVCCCIFFFSLFVWHFCIENTYLPMYILFIFYFLARWIIRLVRKEWKNDRTCSWLWTLPVFAVTDNVSLYLFFCFLYFSLFTP